MSDINANIGVNINTSEALAQLKALQREISNFHSSIVRTTAASIASQKNLESNLLNSINATGQFTAQMGTIRSSTDSFTHALETNKLSMREYFRFAAGATQTFGKLFKTEFNTIGKVAEERVKTLQTQYIKMGRDANGAMQAMSIRPTTLNMQDYTTKAMVAAQKTALFNELLTKGSTNLLNFGKNTQWAGRQLMVGFTVPLTMFGTQAAKAFMDLDTAAINFKKVYGDMFTSSADTAKALEQVQSIAKGFTQYGVAAKDVISTAADIAAMGKTGVDLTNQLNSAVKLSVLGQVDQKTALETTISLTNAFGISADQLSNKINFLNAVENQTVLSLKDVTEAIPRVAPVVKQLGGSVEDLAYFMTAMKEGGINAAQGANALKSALSSMINPTKSAVTMMAGFGINIQGIVKNNAGNLKGTVLGIAKALDTLAPLDRAKAIETMFGKFQFARISTMFQNITKDGSQANKVLGLTKATVEELAILSDREMGTVKDAVTTKYKAAIQQFQLTIAPIGKQFLEAVTPILQTVSKLFDKFNNLSDGTKKFITQAVLIGGVVGPVVLMAFGLLANSIANIIKLFLALKNGFSRIGSDSETLGLQTKYLNTQQLEAATVAASLNQAHVKLTQSFEFETSAVQALRNAYLQANIAAEAFSMSSPGMIRPKKLASGGVITGPGSGTSDSIPAMLSNGEAVIPAANVKKYPGLTAGLVAGSIPGFATGVFNIGGKSLSLDVSRQGTVAPIQGLIDKVLSQLHKVDGLEEVLVETFARVSTQTGLTIDKFVAQLQHSANNMLNISLPESVIGQQSYSAPGKLGSVKKQIQAERGDIGLEEYNRAKAVAEAHLKSYMELGKATDQDVAQVIQIMDGVNNQVAKLAPEQQAYVESFGLSASKVSQLLQVDRAHIVEFTNAEKKYVEAWTSSVWVAAPHLENELSNTLKASEPARQAYLRSLEQESISEDQKANIAAKINSNAALTEEELRIQASVLTRMLADVETMAVVSSKFAPAAEAILAGQAVRNRMPVAPVGVGNRDALIAQEQKGQVTRAINLGSEEFSPAAAGVSTINEFMLAAEQTAQTRSPSKRTFQLGKNIIQGLVNALKGGEAEVAVVAEEVSNAAIPAQKLNTRRASSPGGTVGPDGKIIPVAPANNLNLSEGLEKEATKTKQSLKLLSDRSQRAVNAMSGLTMVASLAGGKIGAIANVAMPFVFGIQGITQVMPSLEKIFLKLPPQVAALAAPLAVLAVSVIAGAVAIKALNKSADDARKAMLDIKLKTSTTSDNLTNMSKFAGTVGAGDILRYRQEQQNKPLGVAAGKTSYGASFVQSADNKGFISGLQQNLVKGNQSQVIADLKRQLSTAVVSGIFTADQAKSIALEMGSKLKNVGVGIKVSAQLDKMFGPNGENVLDPSKSIKIKTQLISEATKKITPISKMPQSIDTGMGIGATTAGGAAIGTMIMPGVGTAIGAIAGAIIGYKALLGNAKLVAAAAASNVASQVQALTVVNEMSASLKLQYESERAKALVAGDTAKVHELDLQYLKDSLKIDKERQKIGVAVLQSYDQSKGRTQAAMLASAKDAAKSRNKDNVDYGLAQELLKGTSGRREYALTVSMATGNLSPEQIVQIMQTFGKDKQTLNTFVNLLPKIGEAGQSKAADILAAFTSNGKVDSKLQSQFILALKATKDGPEAESFLAFYDKIKQQDGILDVTVLTKYFLDPKNIKQKENLDKIFKLIDDKNGEIDINVLTNFLPASGLDQLKKDAPYIASLSSDQKKVFYQEFATIMSISTETKLLEDPEYKKWMADSGPLGGKQYADKGFPTRRAKFAELIAKKYTTANTAVSTKDGGPIDPNAGKTGGTKPADPYAFLQGAIDSVRKFKNLLIDATKPLNALKQIMSGKVKLDTFNGLAEKLAAVKKVGIAGGAGMSEGFMDALLGLDKATFDKLNKKIYTIKNGIITLTAQGKAANKLFDAQALGESAGALQKLARETNEQSKAYRMLIASGLDSATAMKISSDAALASQIANKRLTLTSKEWKQYAAAIKAAKAAEKEASVTNLMDRLRQEVSAINDKKTATDKLTAAGISLARAEEVASDQAAAFAIANGNIKPEDWPILLDLIKKTGSAIGGATDALDEFLKKMHADTKLKMDFAPALLQLKQMGADSQLIQDILGDPALMQSIVDGLGKAENKAAFLKQIIDEATKNRTVNIDFNIIADPKAAINNQINDLTSAIDSQISVIDAQITVVHDQFDPLIAGAQASVDAAQASIDAINAMYDTQINAIQSTIDAQQHAIAQMFDAPISAFQDQISVLQKQMADLIDKPIAALNDKISVLQHQIDMAIDRPIAAINEKINELQRQIELNYSRPLQALSDESNILSNNLTIIGHQEQAINDKYDKQIAALEQVNKINQDISNQKKSQLSIADALSKGDIASAAKAIEEMRAQNAASAATSMTDAMNAARKAEINGITVGGMTKAQIEERQYQIQQQSFKLQEQQKIIEQQIKDYQDQIYQLELKRKPIQDQILQYQDQIYTIEQGRKAIQDQIAAIELKIADLEAQKKVALAQIAVEEEQIYKLKQQQTGELNAANAELKNKQDALAAIQKQMENQLKPLEDQKKKWEDIKDKLILQQDELNKIPLTLEEAKTKAGELAGKITNIGTAAANAAAEIAAMVAQIGAAQTAGAGVSTGITSTTADATTALNKLTSGQTLTAAEYALLGMTPPTSGPSVSLGVGGDQGNPIVGTRLVPGTGIYNGTVFVPPQYYASGGEVAGMFKKKGTDTVPAMLTPGEYVINRHSTKKFRPMLDKINKGKHPHGEHEGRGDGGKPGDNGKPGTGTSTRTGSTRGGEARSYDPGFKGTTGDLNAPSFANGTVGDGMMYAGGNPNFNESGGNQGQGSNGTGNTGGNGQTSAQQASAQKDLLAIEKQIETVLKAIAVLEEQITNVMSMQLQIEQQVQAIYTKLPQLAIQLIAQLNLEKDFATSILELLNKEYKVFEQILTDEILINAQNNIHKEFLLYALDKVTGYPKIFSWLDQMWLKIKNNINPELLFSIENFKQLIIKNEILYKAIAKELIDAIDKVNTALQKVLGTMSGIAAKAQAALAAIMALNTTVVTTHIINTIYTTEGTPPGASTGGNVTSPSGNGGGIPKLFASVGGLIPKYLVSGGPSGIFSPRGTDTIPAMLTPGEFVINANATKDNMDLLHKINSGDVSTSNIRASAKMPTFKKPTSPVQNLSAPTYSGSNLPRQSSSGMNTAVAKTPTSISDNSAVYNYSVSVNVNGAEAGNPNDIANAVMQKIQQVEAQQIRRQAVR